MAALGGGSAMGLAQIVLLQLLCVVLAAEKPIVTWDACGGDTGGYCYYLGKCHNGNTCMCMDGWSGKDCTIPIDCGDISEQLKNVILPPSYYSNFGSLVTYKCKTNYQFPDVGLDKESSEFERLLRCDKNGQWGPNAMSCVAVCPPIPVWRGFVVLSDDYSRLQGAKVMYGCRSYYENYQDLAKSLDREIYYSFVDNSMNMTATCMDNGEWDPPISDCTEPDERPAVQA